MGIKLSILPFFIFQVIFQKVQKIRKQLIVLLYSFKQSIFSILFYMDQEFEYLYTQGQPYSLVMLKNVKAISKLIFSDPERTTFVLISDSHDPKLMVMKQNIQFELGQFFYLFNSVEKARRELMEDRLQQIVFVISIEMFKQGKQLIYLNKTLRVFFFSKETQFYKYMKVQNTEYSESQDLLSQDQDGSQIETQQQAEINQWLPYVLTDVKELGKKLKQFRGVKVSNKALPNFVFTNKQTCISQILLRTMYAMLNQRINNEVIDQLNLKFEELIQEFQNFDKRFQGEKFQQDRSCFFSALKGGLNSNEQIMHWYVDESFVYKILNNLLRAHRSPTQIFYIQPYFTKLFNTIKKLYQQQSKERMKKSKVRNFTVYRGALVEHQQFERFLSSIGEKIQNLGFFSTSLNKKKAEGFIKNAFFEIIVEEIYIGSSQFGYVTLDFWGLGQNNEEEILFNPLNTFSIIDAKKQKQKYYIYLRFEGQQTKNNQQKHKQEIKSKYNTIWELLEKLTNEKQRQESLKIQKQIFEINREIQQKQEAFRKKQESRSAIIVKLQSQQKNYNQCQGNALTNEYYHLKQGELYWNKYSELISVTGYEKIRHLPFNTKFVSDRRMSQLYTKSSYQKSLSKLRYIYCEWNKIYHDLMNRNKRQYERNIIQILLTDFFGVDHSITKKFKFKKQPKAQRQLFNKKVIHDQSQIAYMAQIYKKSLLIEPEYQYFESVIADRNIHNKKQKQIINGFLNLSQSNLNDKKMESEEIRKLLDADIQHLILSQNNLTSLPQCVYTKRFLKSMDLSKNQMQSLDKIGELSLIQCLDLSNNKLRKLPKQFDRLTNLKILNLQFNQLTELPKSIFKLKVLNYLTISSNLLINLPEQIQWQSQLPKLKLSKLHLDSNKIQQIQHFLFNISQLSQLSMGLNQLKNIPKQIQKLAKLQYVGFPKNFLTEIPAEIGKLSQLLWLDLSENKIKSLPKELSQLSKLQLLFLSKNQLTQLPQAVYELTQLEYLYLAQNKLTKIGPEVKKICNLRQLDLQSNQIMNLPKQICSLFKLDQLNILNNPLAQLDGALFKMKKLKLLVNKTDLNKQ